VRVGRREREGAGAVWQRLVDVGAGVEERVRGFDVAAADGKQVR